MSIHIHVYNVISRMHPIIKVKREFRTKKDLSNSKQKYPRKSERCRSREGSRDIWPCCFRDD